MTDLVKCVVPVGGRWGAGATRASGCACRQCGGHGVCVIVGAKVKGRLLPPGKRKIYAHNRTKVKAGQFPTFSRFKGAARHSCVTEAG